MTPAISRSVFNQVKRVACRLHSTAVRSFKILSTLLTTTESTLSLRRISFCVEESISRWYGHGGHWIEIGLPQYISIDHKPENGSEIQNSACGSSGIMLHLEMGTTAEDEKLRDFEGETAHGTSVLARLVAAYSGTKRIVCADLYSASVQSAEMLL